jgi:biopolymer transport protein ExbD
MQVNDGDGSDELVLNLAPMIDVVFLLLIFFMVATTFVEKEKEMGLDLPQAESGEEAERTPDEVVINLMRDGRILVAGEEVDRSALIESLTRVARRDPETPVTIRGDKEVFHQHVVSVMDACRVAGLSNLGVMTLDG